MRFLGGWITLILTRVSREWSQGRMLIVNKLLFNFASGHCPQHSWSDPLVSMDWMTHLYPLLMRLLWPDNLSIRSIRRTEVTNVAIWTFPRCMGLKSYFSLALNMYIRCWLIGSILDFRILAVCNNGFFHCITKIVSPDPVSKLFSGISLKCSKSSL